jgi:hypothetical protein
LGPILWISKFFGRLDRFSPDSFPFVSTSSTERNENFVYTLVEKFMVLKNMKSLQALK